MKTLHNTITAAHLVEVQEYLKNFDSRRAILASGYNESLEYAIGWIIHRMNPSEVAEILCSIYADGNYLSDIIGKLTLRLEVGTLPLNNHNYSKVKADVAHQIITTLVELGYILEDVRVVQSRNEETGKLSFTTQRRLTFGTYVEPTDEEKLVVKGVHSIPGVVLQKRLKVRAGGKALKLNSVEKNFLKSVSSTPLRVLQDIDPEVIGDFIRSTVWYSTAVMDRIVMKQYIATQVEKFRRLQAMGTVYLSAWLDYRTRLYYDLAEQGFNPHGKQFETSLWELADAVVITADGLDKMKYSAVCIIDGRMPHHDAIALFDANVEKYLSALHEVTGDMGEDLYNSRLANAIVDGFNGTPSHFLLSEDATNGGLQCGGIGFKSSPMMISGNVGGDSIVHDSHQDGATGMGMERDEYKKKVSQGLFHGSAITTIAKQLRISTSDAITKLTEAYGPCILNIARIAQWGADVVSNEYTTLVWNTRDGFRAQSISYIEACPLKLQALTTTTKTNLTECSVLMEMPMLKDAKGRPVYGPVEGDKSQGKANKLRGLYANITHSADATRLRAVHRALVEVTGIGGLYKHDNFMCHANHMHVVRHGYKAALVEEFAYSVYETAITQIIEAMPVKPVAPLLVIGDATVDMIEKSHYFLSA